MALEATAESLDVLVLMDRLPRVMLDPPRYSAWTRCNTWLRTEGFTRPRFLARDGIRADMVGVDRATPRNERTENPYGTLNASIRLF
jgi:hypothetical protein